MLLSWLHVTLHLHHSYIFFSVFTIQYHIYYSTSVQLQILFSFNFWFNCSEKYRWTLNPENEMALGIVIHISRVSKCSTRVRATMKALVQGPRQTGPYTPYFHTSYAQQEYKNCIHITQIWGFGVLTRGDFTGGFMRLVKLWWWRRRGCNVGNKLKAMMVGMGGLNFVISTVNGGGKSAYRFTVENLLYIRHGICQKPTTTQFHKKFKIFKILPYVNIL